MKVLCAALAAGTRINPDPPDLTSASGPPYRAKASNEAPDLTVFIHSCSLASEEGVL